MCGIAGAMFWDDTPVSKAQAVVAAMIDAERHRGPDGQGIAVCAERGVGGSEATVVFGHRRLAIIDLSERAAQPMTVDGQVLSFNGEIYNFMAVRQELASAGCTFTSDSDTETILRGFRLWNLGVVDKLQGMFGMAIWDSRERTLHLVRDRLGIKPLYVWRSNGALLFASEIRALLASGLVPRELNRRALDRFLAYQTVPTPETLVAGVQMLPPAAALTARASGQVSERIYWDLLNDADANAKDATRAEAQVRVHDLLLESARLHLVSDVPIALFLSGGIDSSALVALVRQLDIVPQTVGIAFPGTSFDESPFAREVARAFGTSHREVALTEQTLLAQLPEALAAVDHPSGDGINSYVVSRAAREAGCKVAWSGLGGDEFFGGYPSFARLGKLAPWEWAWKRSPAPVRHAAAAAVRTISGSIAAEKTAALLETDGSLAETFPVMRQVFPASQRRRLIGAALQEASGTEGDPYVSLLREADHRTGAGLMSRVSYAEARSYMHDVLLRDTDQMSMCHGLEVRVPLLDHRLASYLMGLPDAAKLSPPDRPKSLLVDSLGTALPDACVNRPKRGFVLPFDVWMRGQLRDFCEARLGTRGLPSRGVVDGAAVAQIWDAFLRSDPQTSWSRVWTLVALDAWLEATGVAV